MTSRNIPRRLLVLAVGLAVALATALPVVAHDGNDDGHDEEHLVRPGSSASLIAHDASLANVISEGSSVNETGPFTPAGRGVRNDEGSTTDVWVHDGYAYTGTFSSPCGGEPGAGVWVWKTKKNGGVSRVGVIPSEVGDRTNDVKVAEMNSGDVLVMSNESCGGGDGGFEIYNVDNPRSPVKLATVTIDELNEVSDFLFGGITNVGVHNLFLFTQGSNDYVAAVAETAFDNFMIFDITDPTSPTRVSAWGAEEIFDPGVGDLTFGDPGEPFAGRVLPAALWLTDGFGASANRFLHDITINADGNRAYLANWDAGLVLLDISDVTNPTLVSVALDPTSEDGEVNSHAVWPSEDGSIVIEGEEDFAPFATAFTIDTGPAAGPYGAAEGAFTTPIFTLPGQVMTGVTTYVGLGCGPISAGSGIALIQRGDCRFDLKATNAIAAGYSGMVVFNAPGDDSFFTMGGNSRDIPGLMVGHSTGLVIAGVAMTTDLVIGATGEEVTASVVPDGWSGYRIWDYTDPSNPVLASTFNTVCSADPIAEICDPAGTYSAHNVIVETNSDDDVIAYISWYTDGILVLDITDPYNPVETGRFGTPATEFWGVYKVPGEEWIYGSDRHGGLWVLQELGASFGRGGGRGRP